MNTTIPNFEERCQNLMRSPHKFTKRQSQSIVMMAFDKSYEAISDSMKISVNAVRGYLFAARQRVNCNENSALIFQLADFIK